MAEQEEYVLWAYRLLLGREPEHPDAVKWPEASRTDILGRVFNSGEFISQHPARAWLAAAKFWFITELANGMRFWVRVSDGEVAPAIITGTHQPAETAFVRRYVRRGMNVVDIGADIGWYTVNMAALVGPAGHVDAFEPSRDIAHYLQRTVTENKFANVSVHRCALTAEDGYGVIVLDSHDRSRSAPRSGIGDALLEGATQQVELRRLDSVVWGAVHFIRIDAAGAERLVFDGADLILSRDRPLILSKIDDEALLRESNISARDYVRYLEDLDYEVRRILPGGRCGDPVFDRDVEAAGAPFSVACLPAERVVELTADRKGR